MCPVALHPDVSGWDRVVTPMEADIWREHLRSHQDRAYCAYLVDGLRGSALGSAMAGANAGVLPLTCNLLWSTQGW